MHADQPGRKSLSYKGAPLRRGIGITVLLGYMMGFEPTAQGNTAAVQIWKDMTGKRPAMRQLLSKRYQIEF
jgi:hypothetical protein